MGSAYGVVIHPTLGLLCSTRIFITSYMDGLIMSKTQGGLVFSRLCGESFVIGNDVTVTVYEVQGNRCKIRVVAPKDVPIMRSELLEQRKAGKQDAS
jgi:carbon storage regulator